MNHHLESDIEQEVSRLLEYLETRSLSPAEVFALLTSTLGEMMNICRKAEVLQDSEIVELANRLSEQIRHVGLAGEDRERSA